MDKQDVLVSDLRVAALAPEGPYYFAWVDENNKIVTLADECQYTEVPEKVAKAVRQHNIKIVDEDLAENNSAPEESNSDTDIMAGKSNTGLIGSPDNSSESIDEQYNVMSGSEINADEEHVSFLVRMDNPEERNKIVNELQSKNTNAAEKLQLTGPFKVVYKIKNNSLELVGVEDMGIGSKTGNIEF